MRRSGFAATMNTASLSVSRAKREIDQEWE
jgi:hypothetical protein